MMIKRVVYDHMFYFSSYNTSNINILIVLSLLMKTHEKEMHLHFSPLFSHLFFSSHHKGDPATGESCAGSPERRIEQPPNKIRAFFGLFESFVDPVQKNSIHHSKFINDNVTYTFHARLKIFQCRTRQIFHISFLPIATERA
jgi:hypothetical protein